MQCRFNNRVTCHLPNEELQTLSYCQCCTLEHIANQLNIMIKQNNNILKELQK
jgi:hypothetical protein